MFVLQAEEQLKLVEDQRKMLEEKQRLEDEHRHQTKRDQEVILNKKNARPKLSFSIGGRWWPPHVACLCCVTASQGSQCPGRQVYMHIFMCICILVIEWSTDHL